MTDELPMHYPDEAPPTPTGERTRRRGDRPDIPPNPAIRRRNRNNRKRGGKAELDVARLLGGRKVGILGHPWDVEMPSYARLQVKKLARWPSLNEVCGMLDAIPTGPEMRGVVVIESAGHGKRGRALVILPLDEYAERHGG